MNYLKNRDTLLCDERGVLNVIDSRVFSEFIEQKRKEYNVAGMAVGVTDRNATVFSAGFGVESVERPTQAVEPQTLFKIASITKMITGIVVMKLVEDGVLNLDTPIKEYVPWLTLSRPEAVDILTLRHLLCHGSGLSSEIRRNGPKDERYLESMLQGLLPELEMESLPGDNVFLYSNYGFVLAAYTAQKVTGKQYSQLATELVLLPLGMTHSFYDLNVVATYPVALPHKEDEDGCLFVEHTISSDATRFGSGEMFTNVIDLCKLMRFFMNYGITDSGERLLSEESVKMMLSKQIVRGDGDHHGFAVHIRQFNGREICGHTGYWPPYRASLFFDLQLGCGVISLLNTNKQDIRDEIMQKAFENM